MKKMFAAIVTAIYGLMLTAAPILAADGQITGSSNVDASVKVLGMCSLNVNTVDIDFGDLLEGATSSSVARSADLTTNTPTTVTIFGTNWIGLTPSNNFGVGQTEYGLDVAPHIDLDLNPGTTLFSSQVDAPHNVNFQVTIPPHPQPADTYSQTVTIGFSCDQD